MPQLEILKIGRNGIGDEGLAALAPPLRGLLHLKELHLYSNQIGSAGVDALLASLGEERFKRLRTLKFAGNRISDAGYMRRECGHDVAICSVGGH